MTRWSAVDDLIVLCSSNGIHLRDVTLTLPPPHRVFLRESMALCGASEAALLGGPDLSRIVALRFGDPQVREAFVLTRSDAVVVGDTVLVPEQCDTALWRHLAEALARHGATTVDSFRVRAAVTHWTTEQLQRLIALYTVDQGAPPDFAAGPWRAMTEAGLALPETGNLLSSCPDPSRIIVVSEPGLGAEATHPATAGWVWNEADRRLYPTGASLEDLAEARWHYDRAAAALEDISLRAAMAGSDGMKRSVIAAQMRRLQEAIQTWATERAIAGAPAFPTLDELCAPGLVLDGMPVNPFNGSAAVQPVEWSARTAAAPSHGSGLDLDPGPGAETGTGPAGWNYDPVRGRIWPNVDGLAMRRLPADPAQSATSSVPTP